MYDHASIKILEFVKGKQVSRKVIERVDNGSYSVRDLSNTLFLRDGYRSIIRNAYTFLGKRVIKNREYFAAIFTYNKDGFSLESPSPRYAPCISEDEIHYRDPEKKMEITKANEAKRKSARSAKNFSGWLKTSPCVAEDHMEMQPETQPEMRQEIRAEIIVPEVSAQVTESNSPVTVEIPGTARVSTFRGAGSDNEYHAVNDFFSDWTNTRPRRGGPISQDGIDAAARAQADLQRIAESDIQRMEAIEQYMRSEMERRAQAQPSRSTYYMYNPFT